MKPYDPFYVYGGRKTEGVGVMKVKEIKLEETESSHTLGGDIKYT